MTYTEAVTFLENLEGIIKESRMGPLTQNHVCGMIHVIIQYLPQAFILLPSTLEE